jgi:hypothetical protein
MCRAHVAWGGGRRGRELLPAGRHGGEASRALDKAHCGLPRCTRHACMTVACLRTAKDQGCGSSGPAPSARASLAMTRPAQPRICTAALLFHRGHLCCLPAACVGSAAGRQRAVCGRRHRSSRGLLQVGGASVQRMHCMCWAPPHTVVYLLCGAAALSYCACKAHQPHQAADEWLTACLRYA